MYGTRDRPGSSSFGDNDLQPVLHRSAASLLRHQSCSAQLLSQMTTTHRLRLAFLALLSFLSFALQLHAANPSFGWANKLWGGDDDGGFAFAVDAEGNSYTATAFFKTDTLNGITMTNAGLYIAKNSAQGNLLWARQIGRSNIFCNSLALDSAGNIFLAGSVYRTATFERTNLCNPSSFDSDAFVAKFDSTGDMRWVRQISGGSYDQANGVALDTNGNVFVTGFFTGQSSFGETNLISRGGEDVFLAKYDSDGNPAWARQFGGTADDVGFSIAVSTAGESWVCGSFNFSADFDEVCTVHGHIQWFSREDGWDGTHRVGPIRGRQ